MTRNLRKLLPFLIALIIDSRERRNQLFFYRIKLKLLKPYFFTVIFFLGAEIISGTNHTIAAQDSLRGNVSDSALFRHSPRRAMMLAAAFPGLGQIYNRKYWKVPLVYIGFGTLAYFMDFNNKKYQHFKKAYLYKIDGDPSTVDIYEQYTEQSVQNAMNAYRRWRDMNLLGTAGFYVLQIIDATVDAYFFEYDITPNLTMHVVPDFRQIDYLAARSTGLRIVFNLK